MQKVRPLTAEELQLVNQRIAAREIFGKTGAKRADSLAAGLIRDDGRLLFPVANDIPVMLLEEALVLG